MRLSQVAGNCEVEIEDTTEITIEESGDGADKEDDGEETEGKDCGTGVDTAEAGGEEDDAGEGKGEGKAAASADADDNGNSTSCSTTKEFCSSDVTVNGVNELVADTETPDCSPTAAAAAAAVTSFDTTSEESDSCSAAAPPAPPAPPLPPLPAAAAPSPTEARGRVSLVPLGKAAAASAPLRKTASVRIVQTRAAQRRCIARAHRLGKPFSFSRGQMMAKRGSE